MIPSLDDYLHAKEIRYQLYLFRDIDDQRNLHSDWTRGTTDYAQPCGLRWYLHLMTTTVTKCKRTEYQLIHSRDFTDQKTCNLIAGETHLTTPNQKW